MRSTTKMVLALGGLILLSPLGLIIPATLGAGSAWGEWGADEMKRLAGHVPAGLNKMSGLWKAPMPDYSFSGWEAKGMPHLSLAYICSGILGAGAIGLAAWLIGKLLAKKSGPPRP